MTRVWIAADRAAQPALLPVDAGDLLPADHVVWDILALVERLDLSGFEAAHRADGRGRPAFHPGVMLALVLYCRAKRLVSSRDVAAACHDDLGARVITGSRYPDRSTVDRFLNTHAGALQRLLPQTLRLGHADGLVDVSVVAGDGTKVLANAAVGATVEEADLRAQIAVLEQQVAAAQAQWAQQAAGVDAAQPALFDDVDTPVGAAVAGSAHTRAWRRLLTVARMLQARQAALAWLRAHPGTATTRWSHRLRRDRDRVARCAQRLEAIQAKVQATALKRGQAAARGRKLPGSAPASTDEHAHVRQARQALATAIARAEATAANPPAAGRVNTTDPTSRIMPGKHDGFGQRHNIQALACTGQFVIAIGTHDSPNDTQALTALLRQGRANLDAAGITDPIGAALFDTGYASDANFTAELPVDPLLVATCKQTRQTAREHEPATAVPAAWQAMTDRLAEPDNHARYQQRAAIIEPLFAQLFARFGRTLHRRGPAVITELHVWAVTHNLLKIIRRRRRRPG